MEHRWKAIWITDPEFAGYEPQPMLNKEYDQVERMAHPEHLKNRHMLVRKQFQLQTAPKEALLCITADDYYKLYVNGHFIGQGPAQGYAFHYNYNEWNLSAYLHEGTNVIAVHVYYQGCVNRYYNSADLRQGMIAELHTEHGLVLATDGSWRYRVACEFGPADTVGYETQYLENIDQRLANVGWIEVEYDDREWLYARENHQADYILVKQSTPPLSVYRLKPQSVRTVRKGDYVIDFGQEVTGQFEMVACGDPGEQIIIRCGEELYESSQTVRYDMRCNCKYEETWTLSGNRDTLRQYEYKAFRYVEVLGLPGTIDVNSFAAMVRHYPLDEQAMTFESNNELLNQIWSICKKGVQFSAQENFVDCPSREKGQYLGDNTVIGHSHMYISGDLRLFKKAIRDFALTSTVCPGLLAVAPGHFMQEIADFSLQWPIQLLLYYEHSGDKEFLQEMLPVAEGILAYFQKYEREDGLLENVKEKWNLVDWPDNLRDGYDFALTRPVSDGCHNVINAFYYGCVKTVQAIKDLLNIKYEDRLPALKKAYQTAFFRPQSGLFADALGTDHASLHSNMLALYFEIVPEHAISSVCALIQMKRLSCGVYMSYFLLKALAKAGETELIYELITCQDERSWANMVKEGATTCFEAWGKEQKWNTSLCHGWASSPIPILIEEIIGIKPAAPGWSSIRFDPHLPDGMPEFSLTFLTMAGKVHIHYAGGHLELIAPEGVVIHRC